MNNYYDFFKKTKGNRDIIYQESLSSFDNKPINILEIGCARDLSQGARMGDGWSTLHFVDYVLKNGGSITICDIDPKSIYNCMNLVRNIDVSICFFCKSSLDFLKSNAKTFDLVLLDGSDEPQDMLNEYEMIKDKTSVILCDDFHTKGSLLRKKYEQFLLYKWKNNPHEFAVYGRTQEIQLLETIQ